MKKALLFSSSAIVIRGAVFYMLVKTDLPNPRQPANAAENFCFSGRRREPCGKGRMEESRVGKAAWRRAAWRKAAKCYGLIVSESDASDRQSF